MTSNTLASCSTASSNFLNILNPCLAGSFWKKCYIHYLCCYRRLQMVHLFRAYSLKTAVLYHGISPTQYIVSIGKRVVEILRFVLISAVQVCSCIPTSSTGYKLAPQIFKEFVFSILLLLVAAWLHTAPNRVTRCRHSADVSYSSINSLWLVFASSITKIRLCTYCKIEFSIASIANVYQESIWLSSFGNQGKYTESHKWSITSHIKAKKQSTSTWLTFLNSPCLLRSFVVTPIPIQPLIICSSFQVVFAGQKGTPNIFWNSVGQKTAKTVWPNI